MTSPLRARYLRWMLYFATAVYMADLRMYYPARHSTDAGHADAIKAKAIEDMERDYDIFAEALGEGPFILGPSMSAVDIYAAMLISWAPDVPQLFARHANIKRLYDLVAARPLCKLPKVLGARIENALGGFFLLGVPKSQARGRWHKRDRRG